MTIDSFADPLEYEAALEEDFLGVISLLAAPDEESKDDATQEEPNLQGIQDPSDLQAQSSTSSEPIKDYRNEPVYLGSEVSTSSYTLLQQETTITSTREFSIANPLHTHHEQLNTERSTVWQEYRTESMKLLFEIQQDKLQKASVREESLDIRTNRKMRPMSAYNLFFKEERARILGTAQKPSVGPTSQEEKRKRRKCPHNKISFAELGRIIGKRWKELGDKERSVFEEKARADKERYKAEKMALAIKQNKTAVPNISHKSAGE